MTGFLKPLTVSYLAMLIPALLFCVSTALALPCNGQAVNIGDSPREVAGKCGEAMLKEERKVKVEEIDDSGKRSAVTTTTDEWTYNFGPGEQMQTYRFEDGKLTDISIPGYGKAPVEMNDTCRNGELLAVGDSYLDAYLKCGEPIAREKRPDMVSETMEGTIKRVTTVPVVEWTYRYGPDLPGYTLTIENGTVTAIRTRKFGE